MALISCPECGKLFSEFADKCPNCGFPRSMVSNDNLINKQPSPQPIKDSKPSSPIEIENTACIPDEIKEAWILACEKNTTSGYYDFLNCFPNSIYAPEARMRLKELKEKRVFDKGVQENNMRVYLRDYPEGKYKDEAIELQKNISASNNSRSWYTVLFFTLVVALLLFLLKDEYLTYSLISALIIPFVIAVGISFTIFDIRKHCKWQLMITLPIALIIGVTFVNILFPTVDLVKGEKQVKSRYAVLWCASDNEGGRISLAPGRHCVINKCGKNLFITKVEYTESTRQIVDEIIIRPNCLNTVGRISYYFHIPPQKISMDEVTKKGRRTYNRHYKKRTIYAINLYSCIGVPAPKGIVVGRN